MSPINLLLVVAVVLISYLIGSISFAVVYSKLFLGKDIRSEGSGNAGATNMLRTGGTGLGILTFVSDILKAMLAAFIGRLVFSYLFDTTGLVMFSPLFGGYLGCIFAMIGHVFPIFFKFKGGKAVSCSVGGLLMCCPIPLLIGLGIFALCVLITKIVSLSSLVATASVLVIAIIMADTSLPVLPQIIFMIIAASIIYIKHAENIKRLLKGTEKKITIGKGGK